MATRILSVWPPFGLLLFDEFAVAAADVDEVADDIDGKSVDEDKELMLQLVYRQKRIKTKQKEDSLLFYQNKRIDRYRLDGFNQTLCIFNDSKG